jgi:hypothetical protein
MDYPAELMRLTVYIYPGWPVTLCLLGKLLSAFIENNYLIVWIVTNQCRKISSLFIYFGRNIILLRASEQLGQKSGNRPPANLPTCFYKYACIIPCTQLYPILLGINIPSNTFGDPADQPQTHIYTLPRLLIFWQENLVTSTQDSRSVLEGLQGWCSDPSLTSSLLLGKTQPHLIAAAF